jgi:transcriptional regulator with XRE-family HTH domain
MADEANDVPGQSADPSNGPTTSQPEPWSLGKRVKDEREHRGWSQLQMAKLLSDNGIPMMHPTTIAKIEAGDRAVRIDEAAGIADLFGVSLDSLLDRRAGLEEDEFTYRLRALRDTAAKHLLEVGVIANAVSERLTDVLQRV